MNTLWIRAINTSIYLKREWIFVLCMQGFVNQQIWFFMLRSGDSHKVEQLWRNLRCDGELIPQRAALNPKAFKKYLPRIAIYEIIPEEKAVFARLIGQEFRDVAGFNYVGTDLNQMSDPKELPARLERQRLYHDQPVGRSGLTVVSFPNGHSATHETLYLPLQGVAGERLLLVCNTRKIVDKSPLYREDEVVCTQQAEEEFVDIGAGIPTLSSTFELTASVS